MTAGTADILSAWPEGRIASATTASVGVSSDAALDGPGRQDVGGPSV
jgi:hypothetical protein